jgi:predicted DNA-binding transcriptional regulator AlpA
MIARTKTLPRRRTTKGSKASPTTALAGLSLKDDCLLGTAEAARLVGLSPKTLRQMRCEKAGPRCLKLGAGRQARCLYRRSDLERWVLSRIVTIQGQA